MLDVRGRPCPLVGAGQVAQRKLPALLSESALAFSRRAHCALNAFGLDKWEPSHRRLGSAPV